MPDGAATAETGDSDATGEGLCVGLADGDGDPAAEGLVDGWGPFVVAPLSSDDLPGPALEAAG